MIALLCAWMITIGGDMTPDEQASEVRRVIQRGDCWNLRYEFYTLRACQCEKTGILSTWDIPNFMPDAQECSYAPRYGLLNGNWR